MANNIKGIIVEIGGDTTGLDAALKGINDESRKTANELKNVEKLLKLDPTNVELLAQKQELLAKQADLAAQRVEKMSEAQELMNKALAEGKIDKGSEQYRQFEREVASAEIEVNKASKAVEEFNESINKTEPPKSFKEQFYGELSEGLDKINTQSKNLKKELGEIDEALELDPTNVELLAQKQQVLAEQSKNAAEKTKLLHEKQLEFNELIERGDIEEGSEEYRKFEREVASAEIELNKANNAVDEFGEKDKDVEKTKKSFEKIKDVASKVGDAIKATTAAIAAIGTAAVAAVAAASAKVAELTTGAAQYADDIATLSTQTGVAAETLQAYGYIQEQVDVSTETLTASMAKNIKSMTSAASGTGAAAEAYKKLGVSVTDGNGNLRDSEEVYWELIDALGQVEDTTERDSLAMQVLGKSAQELNPLIETGSEKLGEMMQQAYDAGAVLSEDTLSSLLGVSDAMEQMKSSGEAVTNNLGALGATLMTEVYKGATQVENAFSGMIQTVLNGGKITDEQTKNMSDAAIDLVKNVTSSLPQLLEAAKEIIKGLFAALEQAFPEILSAISTAFPGVVYLLLSLVPTIIDVGITLLTAIVGDLPTIITTICERLPEIIDNVISALIELTPLLIDAGVTLFVGLVSNMDEIIINIVAKLPEIITAIVDGIGSAVPQLADAGENLIHGLWQGIKDATQWLKDKIKGFMDDVVGGIKSFFGIASPSKLFRDQIGKNLALGIGEGFADQMRTVSDEMERAIPTDFDVAINSAARHTAGAGGHIVRFDVVTPISLGGKTLTNVVSRVQYDEMTGTARAIGVKATQPRLAEAL